MNVFKIAWRSIQHRGLGSVLTILSMALGVMLVVAVLSVHGVVSKSFYSNSNSSFDWILATSGSGMQVTMNTVFYLSKPVENVPYEFYLANCSKERRQEQLQYSVAYQTRLMREQSEMLADRLVGVSMPGCGLSALTDQALRSGTHAVDDARMGINKSGKVNYLVEAAIPINLGDTLDRFRVVGTVPEFFTKIFENRETKTLLSFQEGRAFEEYNDKHEFFEAVLGAHVAKELNLKVGDVINPVHGAQDDPGAHTHEQGFTIVGVLDKTGLPYDRAAYVNLEGFYLMEDHAADPNSTVMADAPVKGATKMKLDDKGKKSLRKIRLPIEQREVTAVLIQTVEAKKKSDDEFLSSGAGTFYEGSVNGGFLKSELNWSDYRPLRTLDQIQAVSPVREVRILFDTFVNPIRWILLALTVMICIVSGISILVGIYSSMSQRRHEIAVMRALGANRTRVMLITLVESVTLAVLGGLFGWIAGHGLNALAGPMIEARTGVPIGFWDFAPGVPLLSYLGLSGLPFLGEGGLEWVRISPELFIIPGLIFLAVLVGVYPSITAYRTDVAESLGS